ncbi:MAG: AIPR family protein [Clostridia bacterium]|nr:AIPR family protein [Clostridia bacterium]
MDKNALYETISSKIKSLKENYPSLRKESDEHIFTVLCVKSNFFKNPSLSFNDSDIENILVDSVKDGGVDALLADPNSETNNMIICQSKYYQSITFDAVRDAVAKMILFYKSMMRGEYEEVNTKVQRAFLSLNAEIGEESKVCFVFYTSAPKSGIREDRIQKLLQEHGLDTINYEIQLYFAEDVVDEIKESESRRPTVENGKIAIDKANNFLEYNEDAIIVNVSAFSIKELFAMHSTNLLSRNLRYFVKKRDIDSSINETISKYPETFWFKNNGLTIICDDFDVSGREVKLKNFSIVNGGQTTSLLHKSKEINKEHDFYLPCKIIRTLGETEDDKNLFSLEIAKATNSQKAIKQIDLKANAPEQVRFGNAMRNVGVFYQTKRGEVIPKDYKEDYKNTDLVEVGKLCLAGIFQLPGSSRSKPSSLYLEKYYTPVFNEDQAQICSLIKELLYIDTYYRKSFIQRFDKEHEESPFASEVIPFAHNARTICISFVTFAARYYSKNIKLSDLKIIFDHINKDKAYDDYYYDIFKDIDGFNMLFPKKLFDNKDKYDEVLYKLFEVIILSGRRYYSTKKELDSTLNESNFLKIDKNYYAILKFDWDSISSKITEIFKLIVL